MKKNILISLLLIISVRSFSQVPDDAIRYSWYPTYGTARYMAIGGAIGSLGGDLTSNFVNPAGLGFYRVNEWVITPGISFNNNKSSFRFEETKNSRNTFNLGTSGAVF